MDQHFDQQSETRKEILIILKQNGSETISSLKKKLNISSEGVRLQLVNLERDGLVKRHTERNNHKGGRPAIIINLTSKGEALFPKEYNTLAIEVIDTVANQLGKGAVKEVLSTMVDARVSEWEYRLNGLSLEEKVAALKDFYILNDSYMEVDYQPDTKTLLLIERNCPFYDVAMKRPILCSVTLNSLTRLLNCLVVREKRFQNGDGCCAFRVHLNEQIERTTFSFEEEEI